MMQPIDIDPVHGAIVDGVSLLISADGHVDDLELEFMYGLIQSMTGVELEQAAALVADSLDRISRTDVRFFIRTIVDRLTDRDSQVYLMVALQLAAMADDHGSENEAAVLDAFAEKFQLSEEEIDTINEQAQALFSASSEG